MNDIFFYTTPFNINKNAYNVLGSVQKEVGDKLCAKPNAKGKKNSQGRWKFRSKYKAFINFIL